MDIFALLFIACISILFGVILTLCVQYYILYVYLKKSPIEKSTLNRNSAEYSLPQSIKEKLENDDLRDNSKGSSLPISLLLQFLFHELRHSESIKRWLYKKLSLEFDELLTKTTIGKFFDSITIKDMHLGTEFPDIKEITVDNVKLDKKEGHLETVSLSLNLDYTGNFMLSIDARMKFGKTAYLSIKVKRISGQARLQFSRQPYTHWSFSFYSDPLLDLAVESHFQGRQLQSNITNLIVNQIKKAIKRKHTLPNYKIRYKPFFVKTDPSQLDVEDNEIVSQGQLEVTCIEITRLSLPPAVQSIYCTMGVDACPWISVYQRGDATYMTLEVTVARGRQTPLGVAFRQERGGVAVEGVSARGPASGSGLRPGDVVLAVDHRPVQTQAQAAKLARAGSTASVTLKVERPVDGGGCAGRWAAAEGGAGDEGRGTGPVEEPVEEVEAGQPEPDASSPAESAKRRAPKMLPTNENMAKLAQTIGSFSLRKRKPSLGDAGSSRGASSSSGPATPQHSAARPPKRAAGGEPPEGGGGDEGGAVGVAGASEVAVEKKFQLYRSKELPNATVLQFNEDFQFNLTDTMKYLNINVWATLADEKDVLLGYTNIPVAHIVGECRRSFLGHCTRRYSLLPPSGAAHPSAQTHPLRAHSGFEQVFCYGDALLAFAWSPDEEAEGGRRRPPVEAGADGGEGGRQHDFVRTQFHRTTHCDFCTKKIWLKDAVQCGRCGLCCHKKCIAKCQMGAACCPSGPKAEPPLRPEITTTEVGEEAAEEEVAGLGEGGGLKRVNSVNNLAIPGTQFMASTSRSLPPSPQRTPSRKQSLVSVNPFAMCPEVLEEVQKNPREASDNVNRLLEQVMQCPPDELLMDAAKESGQQMYAHMTHEERVEKMNVMMGELKKTLDSVTSDHLELSKRMGGEESEVQRAKLAFLMGQADAKVHGLSVLMLHYCSSLQHSQDKII